MSTMKCTELVKNENKSVVEIRDMETNIVKKYVVCSDFDNAKAYGDKWSFGEYFNVEPSLGLYEQEQLRSAILYLYDIKEPKIPYKRVMEFAQAYFKNMDIDSEMADFLKDGLLITEDEAETFGIKEKLFPMKYKVVKLTLTRTQDVTIKVIMPNDEDDCYAENYIERYDYLEDDPKIESYDWDVEDYSVEYDELFEEDVTRRVDLDEIWNGCDFPDRL